MTNADRIRAMLTDRCIAEVHFCNFYGECCDCPLNGMEECMDMDERLKWLKSEVQEDE